MSFLILLAVVGVCFYFGKGFLEKVGLFVTLYSITLLFQACHEKHHDAELVKQLETIRGK
jgi:hypothetical protein